MKRLKFIAIPLISLTILGQASFAYAAPTLKSIQGDSPLDTAIAVAQELNAQTNTYVIVTSINYPDALAGTVLASKYNAPILFSSLFDDQKLLDYLTSKNVNENTKFYILGGTAVVSSSLEDSLKKISPNVIRLGGYTRYDTDNLVNSYLNVAEGTPVILATGELYPDALSMGAIGGQFQYPIYLTDGVKISQNTIEQLQKIKPPTIYIAGGTAVVPSNIENQIKSLLPSTNIVRLAGYDRYETSSIIANYFKSDLNETIYTTGEDFHPALVAAPLAAQHKASILLTDNISPEQQSTMNQQNGYVIGNIKVESLTDADIQRLQSYPTYGSAGQGFFASFSDFYTNERANADGFFKKFNPGSLSVYNNAKVGWLSIPQLEYRTLIGTVGFRGILTLTYYGDNSFGLTPNVAYQCDAEYQVMNSVETGFALNSIKYLSNFRAVNN